MRPRMRRFIHHRGPSLATGLMLAVLLFRAYLPVGFMPASGAPFALEICPSGMPSAMLDPMAAHDSGMHHAGMHHAGRHHASADPSHHDGSHAGFDTCPFGSAPADAVVAHVVAFEPAAHAVFHLLFAFSPAEPGTMLARAHRARGPPFIV